MIPALIPLKIIENVSWQEIAPERFLRIEDHLSPALMATQRKETAYRLADIGRLNLKRIPSVTLEHRVRSYCRERHDCTYIRRYMNELVHFGIF